MTSSKRPVAAIGDAKSRDYECKSSSNPAAGGKGPEKHEESNGYMEGGARKDLETPKGTNREDRRTAVIKSGQSKKLLL